MILKLGKNYLSFDERLEKEMIDFCKSIVKKIVKIFQFFRVHRFKYNYIIHMVKNKTFLVTGTSSGIGEKITDFLLKNDAKVIGLSRKKNNFENSKNFFSY